jgi:hypothetical protein
VFGFLAFGVLFMISRPAAVAQEEKKQEAAAQEEKKPAPPDDGEAMKKLLQKANEEYRLYFKRPEKVPEFWAAIQFEIGLGKFDLAALHLDQLLKKQPAEEVDKDLLKIEEVEGMSTFLRLQTIRKWSENPAFQKEAEKNVDTLINRVTAALEKHLSDPVRISKFIDRLDAPTVEERAYALMQLNRSKARAAPYLIKALRASTGQPLHDRIVEALVRLDPEVVPGFLEVLKARSPKDAQDVDLRVALLDVLKRRADVRAVPYLWHLSASAQYPALVRARAKALLAYLLKADPQFLTPPARALTDLAEKYYRQEIKFADPKGVKIWPWNGQAVDTKPVTLTAVQADEYFGLRYAREALELDPGYEPAQMGFLLLTLNYTYAFEPDQFFLKKMPASLHQLLSTIDAELLTRALERGLNEGNVYVILPLLQVLGERGAVRAVSLQGPPRGVVRALYYPDRRVQYAAAQALVRIPPVTVPAASTRVVEILRRFVAADAPPKALVAFMPGKRGVEVRQAVKGAGFEPVLAGSAKDVFEQLNQAADIDAILLFPPPHEDELPFILAQLRGDKDSGLLPLVLLADMQGRERWVGLASRYRNVWILPDAVLTMPDELKTSLDKYIKQAGGAKLSEKERKEFARVSLDWLWRMAREEIRGYDVRPAQDAVVQALNSKDLAVEAVEILGRLPGTEVQQRLANLVLDPARGKLRLTAALELNRNIQKHGVLLEAQQLKALRTAYQNPMEEPELRTQIGMVIGSLQPSARKTGTRLYEFQPSPK